MVCVWFGGTGLIASPLEAVLPQFLAALGELATPGVLGGVHKKHDPFHGRVLMC